MLQLQQHAASWRPCITHNISQLRCSWSRLAAGGLRYLQAWYRDVGWPHALVHLLLHRQGG